MGLATLASLLFAAKVRATPDDGIARNVLVSQPREQGLGILPEWKPLQVSG